jgi:hypothetical protein
VAGNGGERKPGMVEDWFMVYVFRDRKGVRVRLWFCAKRLVVVGGSCCCKTSPSSILPTTHTTIALQMHLPYGHMQLQL